MLVSIGGFVFWFGCSLISFSLSFLFITFLFLIIFSVLIKVVYLFIYSFFLFFLPFLLSCVADRVLVLQLGIRTEPLSWES